MGNVSHELMMLYQRIYHCTSRGLCTALFSPLRVLAVRAFVLSIAHSRVVCSRARAVYSTDYDELRIV